MTTAFFYLHGFNSGFDHKADKIKSLDTIAPTFGVTTNYLDPKSVKFLGEAIENIDSYFDEVVLVGTSLGGYFARYFAKKFKMRCILINPSTRPYITLNKFLGENTNFLTGEKYFVTESEIASLVEYNVVGSTGSGSLVILATDDELIDYRETTEDLKEAAEIVLTTGGHRLSDINIHLPTIERFVSSMPVPPYHEDDI